MSIEFATALGDCFKLSAAKINLFARAGVITLGDLLFHLPIRYEDRSHIKPVADLTHDKFSQVHAQVLRSHVSYGRRKMLHVMLQDAAGDVLTLRYFQFYPNQQKQFSVGRWGLFYGKAQLGLQGMEFHHPEIQWLAEAELPILDTHLRAVYTTVSRLTQKDWRDNISRALVLVEKEYAVDDPLTAQGFMSFPQALQDIHHPEQIENIEVLESPFHPARKRLILEELCAHQLSILKARNRKALLSAPIAPVNNKKLSALIATFPFELTKAQYRVLYDIQQDLSNSRPMMRLIQGDVGSGKTVVALLAALQVIWSGRQALLMVPTELLAEQHAKNIAKFLSDGDISIEVLISKMPAAKKRTVLDNIATGKANLIIGTHAVFQAQVIYDDLALIMIDEQHRFGVHQRLMLQDKSKHGSGLHQLVLTATPIPRTLAMSLYGELDVSVIDELPKGRKAIQTSVINQEKRAAIIERVGENCRKGGQAYWVCPLIEESEVLECENAENTAALIEQALPDLRIGLVHGRLTQAQRQETMRAFAANEIQLLVATTVIEVGVDVGNASLMIIENAERFGLAQLHQLRGRVGRGTNQSYCVLLYQSPLGEIAKRRLKVMRETNDGFLIAEEDLSIRGAGELLGTKQTGNKLFKIANLDRDHYLLGKVNEFVEQWLKQEPEFVETLISRWMVEQERYLQA